ncbi:MAG: hypothetical protein IKW00_05930 [Clostridia bacterium]|nr:hypothetical protein [Clostridia bacterium]
MSANPYHNQHINEFADCVDNSLYELQAHYDSIILQQQEQIELLMERVTALEQKLSTTPFQLEMMITKDSLKKLRNTIMGAFRK